VYQTVLLINHTFSYSSSITIIIRDVDADRKLIVLFCRVVQLLGLLITYFLLIVQLSTSSLIAMPVSNATVVDWAADAASND